MQISVNRKLTRNRKFPKVAAITAKIFIPMANCCCLTTDEDYCNCQLECFPEVS